MADRGFPIQSQRTKNKRDYIAWKEGKFVPTKRKLQKMRADGFQFPDDVVTVSPGTSLKFEDIRVRKIE